MLRGVYLPYGEEGWGRETGAYKVNDLCESIKASVL